MKSPFALNSTLYFLLGFLLLPAGLWAQLPPLQPEQDCINAIPICQNIYVQNDSYVGEGAIPDEITPSISCLSGGEVNDVWYIFTVSSAGMLSFNITPNVMSNDYDWAVYNLTNAACSDIATNAALQVSCNFSGASGNTGPSQPGSPNSQGAGGSPFNAPIPVSVGETYVINVSNWSSSNAGYTLDFTASTAGIFDNTPPEITEVTFCGSTPSITFSENVVCASVQATDFTLTDLSGNPVPIASVSGTACALGGTFENEFTFTLGAPIPGGVGVLSLTGIVVDNCGNVALPSSDTISQTLLGLAALPDSICAGGTSVLDATAQPLFTYTWNTGATGLPLTVTPTTTTTYTLTALSPDGCVTTEDVTVTVVPEPSAAFSLPAQVCAGQPLDVAYTGDALPGATFSWDFGGATVLAGSGAGPYQLSWSSGGTPDVTLTVSQFGCAGPAVTQAVTVFDLPASTFSAGADVCTNSPNTIAYNGNASPAATYDWDFDGGFFFVGSGGGPYQVEWATPGNKDVCLVVTDNGCVSNPTCQQVAVNPPPAVAISEEVNQCLAGNAFTFAYAGPATLGSYAWDLGEPGATSAAATPTYSYQTAGLKTISLTATDLNGCSATGFAQVEVYPQAEVFFSAPPVCLGVETPFANLTQTEPDAPVALWQWDFGDGQTSTEAEPVHTFGAYGTYPVRLATITTHGCRDTATVDVTVYEQPEAAFTSEPVCDGEAMTFFNTSIYFQGGLTYTWDLGDGTLLNVASQHTYPGPGRYTVILDVFSPEGCTDTYQAEVEVYARPAVAFAAEPVCHNEGTAFLNQTTIGGSGNLAQYAWDFGDGRTAMTASPVYTYGTPGRYPVSLRVESGDGCADSLRQEVVVYPRPQVNFQRAAACTGDSVRFVDRSTIVDTVTGDYLSSWTWDFGDGQQAGSLPRPGHIYATAGTYQVTLTMTSDKGCTASRTLGAISHPVPAAPVPAADTVCFGELAFLMGLPGQDTEEIEWFSSLNAAAPFQTGFTYATPPVVFTQTYYLEGVSDQGCRSGRVPVSAEVFGEGLAKMLVSDTVVELPQAVVNFGVASATGGVTYAWDFGDGKRGNGPAPAHGYDRPGRYAVTVTVTGAQGCSYTLTRTVEVRDLTAVHIPSAFSPNGDGVNDQFYLGVSLFQQLTFRVFNRWGREVYMAQQPDFRWDGRDMQGTAVGSGVYVYHMEGVDWQGNRVDQSGTLTIVR